MRFEVLMALKILLLVFWVVMACGLFIGRYKHYRGTYCLHLQGWRQYVSSKMLMSAYKSALCYNPEDQY
jgi:hypothetical protein